MVFFLIIKSKKNWIGYKGLRNLTPVLWRYLTYQEMSNINFAELVKNPKMNTTKPNYIYTEAVAQRCSVKQVFLEISQNLQENTCARVTFLIKLTKRLWHRFFPVNFAKFLRTSFFTKILRWLLLFISRLGDRYLWIFRRGLF